MDPSKKERMDRSANDFWNIIRPVLEPRLKATIHPLETLQRNTLIDAFDQVGIDAFTVNRNGLLQGLASRMRYQASDVKKPTFSFRYAKWDVLNNQWIRYAEYQRKLHAISSPDKAIIYPHYHVESCIYRKELRWSYIAKTTELVKYIEANHDNKKIIRIFEPHTKERREVVTIDIDAYSKANLSLYCVCHKSKDQPNG